MQVIDLRVPTGVRIVQIGDPISVRSSPPAERLCAQLERLLAAQIGMSSGDDFLIAPLRTGRRGSGRLQGPLITRPLLWVAATWRYIRPRLAGDDLSPAFNRADLVTRTGMVPEIHTLEDAENAYVRFFVPDLVAADRAEKALRADSGLSGIQAALETVPDFSNLLHQSYFTVMTQLARLERRPLTIARSVPVPVPTPVTPPASAPRSNPVVLASEGETSKAYLLDCRRSLFVARIYTVTVEVIYQASRPVQDDLLQSEAPIVRVPDPRVSNERTLSVTISPNPISVTLFAALGGALGSALNPLNDRNPWSMIWSKEGLAAMILAVVFFNIFEFTSLAERFRQATSWRGALLIGVLCGLASEKIITSVVRVL